MAWVFRRRALIQCQCVPAEAAYFLIMNPIVVLLLISSLGVLVLSLLAWRLTSSRSIVFNGLFGAMATLFSAYVLVSHDQRNMFLVYVIPLFVGMAFIGRSIGLLVRIKKEPQLKLPAYYLLGGGSLSLVVSIFAYFAM